MKKLGKKERVKIHNRWVAKYEEFLKLSKEDLKKLYNETKMSSTDRHALIQATQDILYKESQEVKEEESGIKTKEEESKEV